ncbi:MAG: type II toxin-antitoxin system PemK/MazF family toxin [Actinobacteria bacterium]|nr:type II toxin-antitoxin system PemK/MazF family toxin [Actinomycetota bacterium]
MITSAGNPPWPLDVPLCDLDSAGLTAASVVRMKLFTLDLRFIRRKIGALGEADRKAVTSSVAALLGTPSSG